MSPAILETGRRRSWRRWAVPLIVGVMLFAAWFTVRQIANPEAVRTAIVDLLQTQLKGRVVIGGADLSWSGGVRLRNIQIFDSLAANVQTRNRMKGPTRLGDEHPSNVNDLSNNVDGLIEESPAIDVPEIRVDQSLWSLLLHRVDIHSVSVIRPSIRLAFDGPNGELNFTRLLKPRQGSIPESALPSIELRDARVVLVRGGAGGTEYGEEQLQLTVRGRTSGTDPGLYDVVWQDSRDEGGYLQIDLGTGCPRNVRGGLPSVSLKTALMAASMKDSALARRIQDLGLSGRVRVTDFDLMSGASEAGEFIELALNDGAMAIPISEDERALGLQDRYLNFSDVTGHARLTRAGATAELSADFRGADCRVNVSSTPAPSTSTAAPVTLEGALSNVLPRSLDDIRVHAAAEITHFSLPRKGEDASDSERRFVERWPEVTEFYRHYDPHGSLDAELELDKPAGAEAHAAITHVCVTALNGDASFFLHPYRCRQLKGVVEYNASGVSIRELCGRHGDAEVCVNGWLERPSLCAPTNLEILATNLTIDDDLYAAVGPQYHHIRGEFAPEGQLDARIHLARNECQPGEAFAVFRPAIEIELHDIRAQYAQLPYAVEAISGQVEVEGDRFSIEKLSGRAAGGTVSVSGSGRLKGGSDSDLALELNGRDLHIDDRLIAALPAHCATAVAHLHPSGQFDFHTESVRDMGTKAVKHHTLIELNGMSLQDEHYPLDLADLRGELEADSEELTIRGITGRHGEASVSLGGTVPLSESGQLNLAIEARELSIDDSVRAAVPPRIRDVLTEWRVDTPVDVDLYVRSAGDGAADVIVHGDARLNGDTVWHSGFPEPFRDVHALVQFDGTVTRAEHFEATFAGVPLQASFETVAGDDAERGTIRIQAHGLPLNSSTRALLPARLQATWDSIRPEGKVNLEIDALHYVRPMQSRRLPGASNPEEIHVTWDVTGRVEVTDASFSELGHMSKVNGVISAAGSLQDRSGGTTLNGEMRLDRVEVYDRRIENFIGNWAFAWTRGGAGRFVLDPFSGGMYGGELAGKAEVRFDDYRANYDFSAMANKVSLGAFANASRLAHPKSGEPPLEVRGQTSASLFFSGVIGTSQGRRGGGRVEIRDGYICKLPLLLAIFNVLNMTIPSDDTIDQADSDFFLVGNTVTIRDLLLQGGGATFEGQGTVSIPDQAVDLSLVNARSEKGLHIPLISNLVQGATRELMEISVTGPISHPVARARPLPNLSDEMRRVFQVRRTKPIAPLP